MSASDPKSSIYLTDNYQTIILKIKKYAVTGGKPTLFEHKKYGADLKKDVPFKYLTFFLEDDDLLKKIANNYKSGIMNSTEVKTICSDTLIKYVSNYQIARSRINDKNILEYFSAENKWVEIIFYC